MTDVSPTWGNATDPRGFLRALLGPNGIDLGDWFGARSNAAAYTNVRDAIIPPKPKPAPAPAGAADWTLAGPNSTPVPTAQPASVQAGSDIWERLLAAQQKVESGGMAANGKPNMGGNAVSSAGAQGIGQVMPATAMATAKMHGIPYRPDLMLGTTPEALNYQRQMQGIVMQDDLKLAGGDITKALTIYHGGTDPRNYGPKTAAYPGKVLAAAGMAGGLPGTMSTEPANTGSPYMLPNTVTVDPNQAMSFFGPAAHVAAPTLPLAPTLEANPAVPHPEEINKAILDQLAAFAPKTRDASGDFREKLQTVLAAMAQGANSSAAGSPFLSALSSGLAAGGSAGLTEQKTLKAKDEAVTEAQRQFGALLAQQGINLDLKNVDVRNAGRTADYQTGSNQVATRNTNATNTFDTAVKQAMLGFQAGEFNAGADNTRGAQRGQAGVTALTSGAEAVNASGREQTILNENKVRDEAAGIGPGATNPQKKLEKDTGALLASIGVPQQDDPKDPLTTRNARTVAAAVAGGNREGAVSGLARQMILTGAYAGLNGIDVKTAQKIKQHLDAKDVEGATTLMNGILAQNLSSIPALAKHLADQGDPVAKLISDNIKAGKAP